MANRELSAKQMMGLLDKSGIFFFNIEKETLYAVSDSIPEYLKVLENKNWRSLFFLNDKEKFNQVIQSLKTDKIWEGQVYLFSIYMWLNVTIQPSNNSLSTLHCFVRNITKYKQSRIDLIRFRQVLDHSTELILICHADTGYIIDSNQTVSTSLKYDKAALLHMHVKEIHKELELTTPEKWQQFVEDIKGNKKEPKVIKNQHYRADGSSFPVETTFSYESYNNNGYLILISRDITLRNNIEKQKNEALLALEESQNFAKMGNWSIDLSTNKITWSKQVFESFGLKQEDGPPASIDEFRDRIHEEDRDKLKNAMWSAVENDTTCQVEIRQLQADGTFRWYMTKARPKKDFKGTITGLQGINLDIHDRIMAEITSKENQTQLKAITDNLDSIFIYQSIFPGKGIKPYFSYISNNAYQYFKSFFSFGLTEQSLVKQFDGDGLKKLKEIEKQGLKKLKKVEGEIKFFLDNDKTIYRWFLVKSTPFKREDNSIVFNGILVDITDQKKNREKIDVALQKELEFNETLALREEELKKSNDSLLVINNELSRLNNELDNFVYSVSHDLRAPIASVLGLINIAKYAESKEEILGLMQKQEHNIRKMDSFIKDILDYSRNSRTEVKMEALDLEEMIQSVFEQYEFLNDSKNIVKSISVTKGSFVSDRIRMNIILNNLISNAIKYSSNFKENPEIKARVSITKKQAEFVISDNGVGIENTHLDKIFNMFYKASEKAHGSGLGLYIVSESIKKLNGSVSITSKINQGTQVTFTIPNQS